MVSVTEMQCISSVGNSKAGLIISYFVYNCKRFSRVVDEVLHWLLPPVSLQQGDPGLMPEWADDPDNTEVGMFSSSGTFQTVSLPPIIKALALGCNLDGRRLRFSKYASFV